MDAGGGPGDEVVVLAAASCELQAASTSACAHVDSDANMLSMNFKVFVRKAFQRKPSDNDAPHKVGIFLSLALCHGHGHLQ